MNNSMFPKYSLLYSSILFGLSLSFSVQAAGPQIELNTDERKITITDTKEFEQTVLEFNDTTKDIQATRISRDGKYYLVVAKMTDDVIRLYLYDIQGNVLAKKKIFTAIRKKKFSVMRLEVKEGADTQLIQIKAIKLNASGQPKRIIRKQYTVRPNNSEPITFVDDHNTVITYPTNLAELDDQTAGLKLFNYQRKVAGVFPTKRSGDLDRTCILHAEYMRLNDYIGHSEDPAKPGYTEEGNQAGQESNLTAQRNTSMVQAVDTLTAAIYHRIPMISNSVRSIGWAASSRSGQGYYYTCLNVHGDKAYHFIDDVSSEDTTTIFNPENHDPIPYPGVNQTHVPTDFTTGEIPDPLEAFGGSYPAGYPIMLAFSERKKITDASMQLLHPNGAPIDGYFRAPDDPNDPNEIFQGNTITFIPKARLANNTKYTVKVHAKIDGEDYSTEWQFTTE